MLVEPQPDQIPNSQWDRLQQLNHYRVLGDQGGALAAVTVPTA